MTFSVYLPPAAEQGPVPAVWFLSGLTCTDDNVRVKAGAQRYAAELGLALVMPDTSPRGGDVPDEPERYDLGQGRASTSNADRGSLGTALPDVRLRHRRAAGAAGGRTARCCPAALHHRPFHGRPRRADLRAEEPRSCIAPCPPSRRSAIRSHAAGARAASAPISAATAALGKAWDATELIRAGADAPGTPLIDQGTDDEFLADQLHPEALEAACARTRPATDAASAAGYDHSYHFIASFIGEHLA
jgi:S-formylglutathione hydrolase